MIFPIISREVFFAVNFSFLNLSHFHFNFPPRMILYSSLYRCLCNSNPHMWRVLNGMKAREVREDTNEHRCWKLKIWCIAIENLFDIFERERERDDYRIMIKPFLCIHNLHSLTHSFYIVVHAASRLYGDGSSVRCCCLHCHGYCCESLSHSGSHSICAKTFFTHDNIMYA